MIGREQSRDLKDFLQKYEPSGRFTGMVGPEGGFTPEEVSTAQHAGFIPVSMGSRILRLKPRPWSWRPLLNMNGGIFAWAKAAALGNALRFHKPP